MRLLLAISIVAFIVTVSSNATAQSSDLGSNYTVQFVNDTFTVLNGSALIGPEQFHDNAGAIDHDNGMAVNIPVGFTFEYNGNSYSSVNVSINGWVSFGNAPMPLLTKDPLALFSASLPNNILAPFWGDHYYRTLESGYQASRISFLTTFQPDQNSVSKPPLHNFYLEWKDLNITDQANSHSVATFELRIIQNPEANSTTAPDQRATFEFRYGSANNSAEVLGASVGAKDSLGRSFVNALFESSQFRGDSTRLSTTRTTCWPPTDCLPFKAIQIVPRPFNAAVSVPSDNASLSVFPQPSRGDLYIESRDASSIASIKIYDMLGALRFEKEGFDSDEIRLHNLNLPAGAYTAIVERRDGEITNTRVVIE